MSPRLLWLLWLMILNAMLLQGHELVDISKTNRNICVHLRDRGYQKAYLVKQVARQLSRVQYDLDRDCISLVIFDAYRPFCYSEFFETPYAFNPVDECNPVINGHYRGTAVDVSLVYQDGQSLEMPPFLNIYELEALGCDYHSFSCTAYHNLQKLQKAMEKHRFVPSSTEWWHFDYKDWFQYPVLDVPFQDL
jgi:D-alanyl-D-alanine dipeptidase